MIQTDSGRVARNAQHFVGDGSVLPCVQDEKPCAAYDETPSVTAQVFKQPIQGNQNQIMHHVLEWLEKGSFCKYKGYMYNYDFMQGPLFSYF